MNAKTRHAPSWSLFSPGLSAAILVMATIAARGSIELPEVFSDQRWFVIIHSQTDLTSTPTNCWQPAGLLPTVFNSIFPNVCKNGFRTA